MEELAPSTLATRWQLIFPARGCYLSAAIFLSLDSSKTDPYDSLESFDNYSSFTFISAEFYLLSKELNSRLKSEGCSIHHLLTRSVRASDGGRSYFSRRV